MTLNEFRKLCINFLTDNISVEEQNLLKKQIEQSKEFREEFEISKKIWEASKNNSIQQEIFVDVDWTKIESQLDLSNSSPKKVKSSNIFGAFWKPATAIVVMGLLILATFIITEQNQNLLLKTITVSTNNGEQKKVTLPDGSNVTLNSASQIEYPENFNSDTREIMLRGEAFFVVTKGTSPFIVSTHNAKTTVLGTEFNVKARGKNTEVIVKEGLVNLATNAKSDKSVNIAPGFSSVVAMQTAATQPKPIDSKKMLGWLDGKLVFEQTNLKEISGELERFYNVKVSLNSTSLNKISITGSFLKTDIDTTLSMICLTLNLDYEKVEDSYIIKKK